MSQTVYILKHITDGANRVFWFGVGCHYLMVSGGLSINPLGFIQWEVFNCLKSSIGHQYGSHGISYYDIIGMWMM